MPDTTEKKTIPRGPAATAAKNKYTRLNKDKGNPFLFGPKIRLPVGVDTASGLMKLIGL